MAWSRRKVVQVIGAILSTGFMWSIMPVHSSQRDERIYTLLLAYTDTIIPRDEKLGAVDLGAHERIASRMRSDQGFLTIVEASLKSLDKRAKVRFGAPFDRLDQQRRELIVGEIARRPIEDMLGWFFNATRAEIFMAYYARPESWSGLGINRPPQPYGYPDAQHPWSPVGR